MSDFESDLPSAMPEKLDTTQFIADVESRLAEGVSVPPVLESLREARDTGADTNVLTGLIYELMIEQGMLHDQNPESGMLTYTDFDIEANWDVKEVKEEFAYLYKYG